MPGGQKLKLKGMLEKAIGQEPAVKTQPTGIESFRLTVDRAMGLESERSGVRGLAQSARERAGVPGADSCCPNLTVAQRVQGCIACFVIGLAISFIGFLSWWSGKIGTFAALYTIGNVVSLSGSCFLFGPRRQARQMFEAKRAYATAIYLAMMVITLVLAFHGANKGLVLMCCVLQWCAAVWYVASYIPFGQKIIKKTLGSLSGL